jgi:uncharacterized protein
VIVDLDTLVGPQVTIESDEVVAFYDRIFDRDSPISCHVQLSVRRVGETFFLHAVLRGILDTVCHRCLDPARCVLDSEFDLVVKRGTEEEEPVDEPEEDFLFLHRGDHLVSLDEQIYESLVSTIPMRILCREDCRGLCPQCGANLNRESCSCEPPPDPRWEALLRLKKKLEGEG